jgi:hypothetical protein
MNTETDPTGTTEQTETVAALCARGYNEHIRLHGPDDSYAGEPVPTRDGMGFVVVRDGQEFLVYVKPTGR